MAFWLAEAMSRLGSRHELICLLEGNGEIGGVIDWGLARGGAGWRLVVDQPSKSDLHI